MEKTKYKIGEFSKLARVTVRTLRHYEDIGLLKPDIVDKIYFDTLPAIIVASNKTILENYDALGMHLCTVVGPEMARLGCECYVDGIWNQEDPEKWLTIIQVPVRKRASARRPTP